MLWAASTSPAVAQPGAGELLTSEEREWLAAHDGKIRYAPCPDYPPLDYVDADGNPTGLAADYVRIIERRLGICFEVVRCQSWKDMIERAKRGEVDLISSIQDTPERHDFLRFTAPFDRVPNAIVTREEVRRTLTLDKLGGMKVAIVDGYATIDWVRERNPEVIVLPVPDNPSGLQAVSFGRADVMITDLAVASYFIDTLGIANLRVAGMVDYSWNLTFGSRKDWPILNRVLDKVLAEIGPEQRQAMRRKWISARLPGEVDYRVLGMYAGGTLAVVLVAAGLFLAWNLSLKRKVRVRTEALERELATRKRMEEERSRLEAQLRHSQKMEAVGQLAGGLAHDFNNILTSILGNVELSTEELSQRRPADEVVMQELDQVRQAAERAADLTRQLLVFSRRDIAQPVVVDMNQALARTERLLRRVLAENIELSLVCGGDLQRVRVDPGQFEQVVLNLVVNARDAMPDGGRLVLETANVYLDSSYVESHTDARTGPHVLLAASDTGCGMDAATRERIFEPFFTTKAPGAGTGLGLATVHGIVTQAGGHIRVYSEPGSGTTFKVYLPAVDAPTETPSAVVDESDITGGDETVLVCEDDENVRTLACQMLRAVGYEVLAAANGAQALALMQRRPGRLDLLLTDVIMPGMNGRQLAETLAAHRPGLRVLYVSGYTANVIASHGVLDENIEFLEKPFTRRALLQRVRRVLDGQSGQRSGTA